MGGAGKAYCKLDRDPLLSKRAESSFSTSLSSMSKTTGEDWSPSSSEKSRRIGVVLLCHLDLGFVRMVCFDVEARPYVRDILSGVYASCGSPQRLIDGVIGSVQEKILRDAKVFVRKVVIVERKK